MRIKPLLVVMGVLVVGYLAGRFQPRPGQERVPTAAPASNRQPDRAAAAVSATRSSYADLERHFASLPGLHRTTALTSTVSRLDLTKVKQLLAESGGGGARYYSRFGESNLRQALFQRWAELDPESLITHAMAQHTMERFEGLRYALTAMTEQDYEAATARLQQFAPDLRDNLKSAVFEVLATRDPERAFRTALDADAATQWTYLSTALAKLAASDSARAIAACAALPPGKERQQCLNVLAFTMAARDPEAAIAWAGKLDNALERTNATKAILNNLAFSDPLKALAVLEQGLPINSDAFGGSVYSSIFANLARLDFDLAKDEILKLKVPAKRIQALAALAGTSKQNHADELLALAATLPTAEAKALYLGDFWDYSQDPAKLTAWLEKIPDGPLRQQAKLKALNSLAYQDPETAAKQLATLQPTMLDYSAPIGQIAYAWSAQNPAKALEWANQLGNFDQKKQALQQIYTTLADADPTTAATRLAEITDPKLRTEITATVVGRWATLEPAAALAWSRTLPPEERSAALRQIAGSQISGNPTLARQIFDQMIQQFPPDEWNKSETRDTAGQMATELAETDPQAAAKFAEALPAGSAQEEAYAKVIGAWGRYAPAEAESWLGQMPDGGIRDQAAATFVATVASSDPAKAYQWAVSIADPALRREAAEQSLRAWKDNGQLEQARSALDQAGVFSEQDLKELRKAIE
jgi:hypothetical protein